MKKRTEYDRETMRKAIYASVPELIFEKDLSPMEAMSITIYKLGYSNSEVSQIMTDLLERDVNPVRVNDYKRRAEYKLIQNQVGDHQNDTDEK